MDRHRARTRALVGLASVAVLATSTVGPAWAVDEATALPHRPTSVVGDSTYLAGYTTTTGDVVAASTRSFTVPSYRCGAEMTGIMVGILDLQAEGLPYALADVYLACVDGEPLVVTEAFVTDTVDQGTASAGDRLRFSLSTAGGMITAEVINLTDPAGSATVTKRGVLARDLHLGAGPLIGPDGTLPVPDLGTITLVRSRTSAGRLTRAGTDRIDRVRDGITELRAGKLRRGTFSLVG